MACNKKEAKRIAVKFFAEIMMILLLVATCAFANWTGETKEPELRTKIDGKIFYLISTPEELAWFATQVNSGKTEINAKLSKDIVLWEDSLTSGSEATSWTPIGDSLTKSFNGIFDGDNHVIRGLYVSKGYEIYRTYQSDSICLGLFGSLGVGGVVKNLKFENTYVTASVRNYNSTKNRINIGGVIGTSDGRVENILFKGVLKTSGNIGGLVGKNNGHIEEVSFEGSISSVSGNIGGIVGFNTGSIKNAVSVGDIHSPGYKGEQSYIGGIVGYTENGLSIENCENYADITTGGTDGYIVIGGIAGFLKTASILNSTNIGTIQSNRGLVGGIIGSAESAIIDNCKNEGSILGDHYDVAAAPSMGGIIESGRSVIIRDCLNNGSITGCIGCTSGRACGIAGSIDSVSTIDNCINNRIVKADKAAGIVCSGGGSVANSINNDSIIAKVDAAGIAIYANVIDNCTNNGTVVSGKNSSLCGTSCSGGIAIAADTIKNCTNNGRVSASIITHTNQDKHDCDMDIYAGGIAAYGGSYIGKSVNKGRISAYGELSHRPSGNYGSGSCCGREVYAGGIVGRCYTKITDSYNLANVDARIRLEGGYLYENGIWVGGIAGYADSAQNVYSAADSVIGYISGGTNNYAYKGALFGRVKKVNNAYYDLKIKNISVSIANDKADTVNVDALSTADMQKDQFAWTLNTTAGTQDNTSTWSRKDGYPIFADTENLPIYRVAFDDDGASNYYRYTYEYSNNKGLTSVPKNLDPAEGYRFVAWVKENGNVFDGKQIVPEDMTVSALYAPFTAKIYSVTFEYPKGQEIAVALTNENGRLNNLPEAPLMNENYQFKGWYDSSSSLVTTSTVFTADATVTAVYELKTNSSSGSIAESSSSSAKSSNSGNKNTEAFVASDIPTFYVSVVEYSIQIANAKVGSAYAIFDMQGRVLKKGRVESANFNIPMNMAGNYLVRVDNRTQRISIK